MGLSVSGRRLTWIQEPASGATVGFWAAEAGAEQYYQPFDTSSTFTPDVWQVLQEDHVPLYLNVRYGRDFGPVGADALLGRVRFAYWPPRRLRRG